jgi:hypothetical protein
LTLFENKLSRFPVNHLAPLMGHGAHSRELSIKQQQGFAGNTTRSLTSMIRQPTAPARAGTRVWGNAGWASAVPLVERPAYGESGVAPELGIPALPGSAPFGHGGALPLIQSRQACTARLVQLNP